jgi:hypothetical protein
VPHQSRRKDVVREQPTAQSFESGCGVLRDEQASLANVLIYRCVLRTLWR